MPHDSSTLLGIVVGEVDGEGNKREEISKTSPGRVLTTLPDNFQNISSIPLKLESEEPQHLIELIGGCLGVTDYKTNMAAFWFLDTLSLQVLRYKEILNEVQRGILISWLAGEMKLIRDLKPLRQDFIDLMKQIFVATNEKVSQGKQVLHWNSMTLQPFIRKIIYKETPESSAENINNEDQSFLNKKTSREAVFGSRPETRKSSKNRAKRNSLNNKIEKENDLKIRSNTVLDVIIEATYDMYAGDLRYFLIYSTFVESIEMITYHLPSVYRVPRRIKTAENYESLDTQIQKALERKNMFEEDEDKKITTKKKVTNKKSPIQEKKIDDMELPPPPPSSLIEEEKLELNRRFILPLIESNEASSILYQEDREILSAN